MRTIEVHHPASLLSRVPQCGHPYFRKACRLINISKCEIFGKALYKVKAEVASSGLL